MDISSYIVETSPQRIEQVRANLSALPGVEVHAHDAYRLVVTIESQSIETTYDLATAISKIDGVSATNLIYHNFEYAQANAC